jgi:UDP-N-acetylglucosamine--N-acetylmuramyl-(pentapeptide) pyrophosphoryl-undecaprenol N-acetylglucosamine transferase
MKKTILIMAGGTGGHIMPGLSVADCLKAEGWRVVWMGNPAGMEARLVPAQGYEMSWVHFRALRGKGFLRKLLLPISLLQAFSQARKEIRRIQPDVVLGMGGYITFPGGMVAAMMGIPLVLHEQNSVAGLANRVLARFARRVLCGFPDTLRQGQWIGNPVRAEIAALPSPAVRYAQRHGPLKVLVLGGSLGATVLNETVPQALALLKENERPQVTHQAGEKHMQALMLAYQREDIAAKLVPFIEDMAAAYAEADLVICRAGALTIAELAAAGVASVLVPFLHAVDDHQTSNAHFLCSAGAAILLPQNELTPDRLADLRHLGRGQLLQMAGQARALARPNAAQAVACVCMEVAK